MIFQGPSWIDKRELAKESLNKAKQANNLEACKAAAWEIEFWGRVSNLESRMTLHGYSYEWLQQQIKNVLLADKRYFTDLSTSEPDYMLIPTKIRAILDDQH